MSSIITQQLPLLSWENIQGIMETSILMENAAQNSGSNPSEFNDLRVVSRNMIGPEDLMPKGTAHEKSARPIGESKRQDMRLNKPIPSGKECEKQKK
ncbi:hypothetical protein RDABS01_036641 [Bienertia sinuspersici]